MLTADLVVTRRHGDVLSVVPFADRERIRELAADVLGVVSERIGSPRDEVEEALDSLPASPKEQKLREALCKLALDRCVFEADWAVEPMKLRALVFTEAARRRRDRTFVRPDVVGHVARSLGLDENALESHLFADLKGSHRLVRLESTHPDTLARAYELGQVQAVLLRAVRVKVDVRAPPQTLRVLFRKLKFLRLLFTLERSSSGFAITLDGPLSLFGPVTKYGRELALLVPTLELCDEWNLTADVRWGKERRALRFQAKGPIGPSSPSNERSSFSLDDLVEETATVARRIRDSGAVWLVRPASVVLEAPGVGLAVPDLTFERTDGKVVHVEVMGYWSRDAVWRRIELIERGLPEPMVVCVSERLRVSEEALGAEASGALYVYKSVMNPRALLETIERVAGPA